MRILEKGEDKVYIKRCSNCNSLIEFERTEVEYNYIFGRYEASCPLCKQRISFSSNDLLPRNYKPSTQIAEECLQDIKS